MTYLIIDKFHSVIDVITNSSTEIFISNTDKSVETVWEFLEEASKLIEYEDPTCGVGRVYEITESNLKEFFNTMKYYLHDFEDDYLDSCGYEYRYFKEKGWNIDESDIELFKKHREEACKSYKEYQDKFWEENNGLYEDYIGKIVIEGEDDNSIPYELFDIIDRKLNAVHYHL